MQFVRRRRSLRESSEKQKKELKKTLDTVGVVRDSAFTSHYTGVVSLRDEGRMKSCILLLLISLFLASVARALPQQSPDPKQANLIAYAHFKALTPAELNQLLSKAASGDAEAQYWMGIFYTEGKVPKNLKKAVDGC
jgi:hypothetical protein